MNYDMNRTLNASFIMILERYFDVIEWRTGVIDWARTDALLLSHIYIQKKNWLYYRWNSLSLVYFNIGLTYSYTQSLFSRNQFFSLSLALCFLLDTNTITNTTVDSCCVVLGIPLFFLLSNSTRKDKQERLSSQRTCIKRKKRGSNAFSGLF